MVEGPAERKGKYFFGEVRSKVQLAGDFKKLNGTTN